MFRPTEPPMSRGSSREAAVGTVELRKDYLGHVADLVASYIRDGHPVRLRTWHGQAEEANELVFEIADWAAFVAIMEPMAHPVG
jgi:hypothetical protein